jgi:hypothetical protein
MPVFRKVNTSYWQDPFILDLKYEEKAFYLYLITNSKTKQCGIYELPMKVIEMETGLDHEKIRTLLKKFIDEKKVVIDDNSNEILIVNWTKNNYSSSPKVQTCIDRKIRQVKSKMLISDYNTIVKEYINTINTISQEEKEEEKKEKKEDEKEALFLMQLRNLYSIWDIKVIEEDKDLIRLLIGIYGVDKVKDVFYKAVDKGKNYCNITFVQETLRKI